DAGNADPVQLHLRGHADRVRADRDPPRSGRPRICGGKPVRTAGCRGRGRMTPILFAAFFLLLALGVPVAFSLAIAAAAAITLASNYPLLVVIKEMFAGLDSFPLMAVPFFILAAELMTGGAMTHVLL